MTPGTPPSKRALTRIGLVAVFTVSVVTGCGEPPKPSPAARSPSPSPTARESGDGDQEIGTLAQARCPFVLPEGIEEGEDVTCGMLAVPERWDIPDLAATRTIHLAVARFRATGNTQQAAPVIYLSGGPGGSTLESLRYGMPEAFTRIISAGYELIIYDQRGVGRSRPALDCPDVPAVVRDLADRQVSGAAIAPDEARDRLVTAFVACGQELSKSADLSAYNSVASAHDVEALREALGAPAVILWGGSYGTRLALEVMRQHPDGVRSVVLDAVYPPDVDLYVEAPANFDRALQRLFDLCEANDICAGRYPDLGPTFYDTVARLNTAPIPTTLTDLSTGDDIPALADGDALVGVVFQLLYSTDAKLLIPELIWDASHDEIAALNNIRSVLLAQQSLSSRGQMFSVQCHEEIPFSAAEAAGEAGARYPELGGTFAHGLLGQLTYDVCAQWNAGRADPAANEPVVSEIPTLIMTGEFDPITPPSWGMHVAETLSHAYAFEYPGIGHGAGIAGGCPEQMFFEFLADPSHAPDDACIASMLP